MAGTISMGARRGFLSAVAERYWSAGRVEKGRILDALCRTTGWHRKHAVRALRRRVVDKAVETEAPRERKRRYGATIKDALTALWEASACLRQAARGDDPDPCAGIGATRPVAAVVLRGRLSSLLDPIGPIPRRQAPACPLPT
jgi:hypothetical protein